MEITKNGIRYDVQRDYCVVLGYAKNTQYGGTLKIPCSLYSKPVTKIMDDAFAGSSIEEVVLPKSLESIGARAFASCQNLKSVKCGRNYTNVSKTLHLFHKAFAGCAMLETVEVYQNLLTEDFAFHGCTNLAKVSKIQSLGFQVFGKCKNLTTVSLSDEASINQESFVNSAITTLQLYGFHDSISDVENVLDVLNTHNIRIKCHATSPMVNLAYAGIFVELLN